EHCQIGSARGEPSSMRSQSGRVGSCCCLHSPSFPQCATAPSSNSCSRARGRCHERCCRCALRVQRRQVPPPSATEPPAFSTVNCELVNGTRPSTATRPGGAEAIG